MSKDQEYKDICNHIAVSAGKHRFVQPFDHAVAPEVAATTRFHLPFRWDDLLLDLKTTFIEGIFTFCSSVSLEEVFMSDGTSRCPAVNQSLPTTV